MNNQTNFASKATDRTTDVWLTPYDIRKPLGEFDLDPCAAPDPEKWPMAKNHFTEKNDGLKQKWFGRVWLNPPYSTAYEWLDLLANHGCGTALIFARTETKGFFSSVWERAHGLLFVKGRICFHEISCANCGEGSSKHRPEFHCKTLDATGPIIKGGTSGAPSVLIAYGVQDSIKLFWVAKHNQIHGKYINLKNQ